MSRVVTFSRIPAGASWSARAPAAAVPVMAGFAPGSGHRPPRTPVAHRSAGAASSRYVSGSCRVRRRAAPAPAVRRRFAHRTRSLRPQSGCRTGSPVIRRFPGRTSRGPDAPHAARWCGLIHGTDQPPWPVAAAPGHPRKTMCPHCRPGQRTESENRCPRA